MTTDRNVLVIGAGAAGMMAAITAAEQGAKVTVLERMNRPGRKLLITGKGRCNITNDCPWRDALSSIPVGSRFLFSAMSRFTPADAMEFFENLGVPLKTERGRRVFPVSDKSMDVVDALDRRMKKLGIKRAECRANGLIIEDGRAVGAHTDKGDFRADAVIVATGGMSYPATGSDGDGYEFAKAAGHTVIEPKPSLVPLESDDPCCAEMMGLALRNVGIKICEQGKTKPVYQDFGELLFTHFGLSGPTILSASAHMRDFDKKSWKVSIDLKPALDEKTLDARILRDFEKYANRDFENALGDLYSRTMIPVIVRRSGIPGNLKVNSVTKAQRRKLLEITKAFDIDVTGPRPIAEAIITSGGVKLSEVEPSTMASKILPGLYFAGEVLDADAYTGGFNLQIAWSTGRAAGIAAAEKTI
ncbi:MAG: NAD(P)/FAD-dependent oxidoreductase [Oscillospiraceae bacterium]|nr:NAD(P)/FAD-dependent oxidoreductase [Oscillospiraceae bacterium]